MWRRRKDSGEAPDPETVVLGRIAGLYGVSGWVRIYSYTEPREALLSYRECLLRRNGRWTPATLAEGRRQGKGMVARFGDIEDRDTAATLVGADIGVLRASLPETAAGQYYWTDLEGLQVRRADGKILGRVAYMMATGANDVMAVRPTQGSEDVESREILIPFVRDRYVLDVDLDAGVIDVDWDWD